MKLTYGSDSIWRKYILITSVRIFTISFVVKFAFANIITVYILARAFHATRTRRTITFIYICIRCKKTYTFTYLISRTFNTYEK
jgi:hypothetical protein